MRASLQIAATLVLAALSWRFIEQPVRHGALGRQWSRSGAASDPAPPEAGGLGGGRRRLVQRHPLCRGPGRAGVGLGGRPGLQVTSIVPHVHRVVSSSTTTTDVPPPPGQGVTAIGDSIMVDAAPYLQTSLPGIAIDAQVGQQLTQVQAAVPQLKSEGAVGSRLIIELGTNGPFSSAQLTGLLDALGPAQRVVLVNTHVPRPWQQQVNDSIASVAQTYPAAVLVDWATDSANNPQYFYPDGVHLDPAGARYYASLLVQALNQPLAKSGGR